MVLMRYTITLRHERKKKYDHLWIQVKILRSSVHVAQMKDRVEKYYQNVGDTEG